MLCLKTSAVVVKAKIIRHKLASFSLIEILISLALGSFLLFSFASLYSHFLISQTEQKTLLALQKEAHQLLNYFQQHIQHLGYQNGMREESNVVLFEQDNRRYALRDNCLIFFYDLNSDGCLGKRATKKSACLNNELNNTKDLAKEIFGFRVENKEIYFYASNKLENCTKEQCKQLLSSCDETWMKFTSSDQFRVDKLKFSWKKKNELLQVDLLLSSVNDKKVNYKTISYVYILNSENL